MKGFDHYKGKYGEYPVMKEARTRRMKSMGLMRQDMQINWGTDHYERWEASAV